MAGLSNEERAALVDSLSFAAQAELSEPRIILPVAEHLRALEPDVVLVVGDRGAGKTQLVRALEDEKVRAALVAQVPGLRAPKGPAQWRTGWPLLAKGPTPSAWRKFAVSAESNREDTLSIWLAYLLRVLGKDIDDIARAELKTLLEASGSDAGACLGLFRPLDTKGTDALDRLDEQLAREGRWLFVAYDELDTLVFDDWQALGVIVRGLVSFWAAYARRWQRIRPKLFLRSDFYKHHREITGADVAKLAANRVELQWSDKNLYGVLIKHVLNKKDADGGNRLFDHFRKFVEVTDDSVLGHLPRLSRARDAKPFVDRLVSEYMGADKSKGQAFTWLLNHLRDGRGHALPRTLVWLVEFAAERERDDPRAAGAHLLHHVSLRNALGKVSKQYVDQAKTNELPWLEGLGDRLMRERKVPWRRRDLVKLLSHEFEDTWGLQGDVRPPGQTPEEVVGSLLELGVLRERPDGAFDVPDLYLEGLGLLRRGGVAQK